LARRFALLFASSSCVLLALYYFPYPEGSWMKHELAGYLRAYAATSGAVLRWFDPSVNVYGQDIVGRYAIRIVRTCDAMDVQILFVCAVLAWPTGWRKRALVAAGGAAALFVINIVRICSLYYVGLRRPSWFDFVHLELWPAIMVIGAVAAFAAFASWTRRTDALPAVTA
jgi:exosortase H (IPTLxxWG-CTERM-specific)